MRLSVPLLISTSFLLHLPLSEVLAKKRPFRHVTRQDGIVVSEREAPGRGFPTFRGVGLVQANLFDVLAVISDIKRHTEWVDQCVAAKLLKKVSEQERILYTRTNVPWPISDRDAVFYSRAHVSPSKREVLIKIKAVHSKHMPRVPGVVRMTRLRAHFKLRGLTEKVTWIEYQVDADPGGMLPKWLAKIATKRLPLDTIRNLRKQVKRTLGWYHKRIKRWKGMAKTAQQRRR